MLLAPYELRFRKPVMYAFGTMSAIGNGTSLIGGFFTSGSTSTQRSALIVLMGLAVILLTHFNKVRAAGGLFCTTGTLLITLSILDSGLNTFVPTFYIVIIVIAAAIISPIATIIFGVTSSVLYIAASSWVISQSPKPVAADTGAGVAILALVLLSSTALLYIFSDSLGKVLGAARQQSEELQRLNDALKRQRVVESQTVQQVNELAGTLSQLLDEQNSTSRTQAIMVNDVAVATQELDAVVRKIAENAGSVANTAEKAQKSVEVGQDMANKGVEAIAAMRQRVQEINTNMLTLNQQLENISEVTGIIGEIADETNLLALNATIEAAGAREYGRRFAAVADEVQRLARRATNAVEQIQEMVAQINQASDRALAATEQGLREAQIGDKLVSTLNVANEDVIHLIAQTSTLASSIATATQQQREASAQIVDVMQRIIVTANWLAQAGNDVSRIVNTLEESSEQLILDFAPSNDILTNFI